MKCLSSVVMLVVILAAAPAFAGTPHFLKPYARPAAAAAVVKVAPSATAKAQWFSIGLGSSNGNYVGFGYNRGNYAYNYGYNNSLGYGAGYGNNYGYANYGYRNYGYSNYNNYNSYSNYGYRNYGYNNYATYGYRRW